MHQDDAMCYSSKLKLYARIFSSETQSEVCFSSELNGDVRISSSETQSVLQTSPDAVNWTAVDIRTSYTIFWKSLFWSTSREIFVAIGDAKGYCPPDKYAISSSDGINWTNTYTTAIYSIFFDEIKALNKATEKMDELTATVADLKEMVTQIFYAPGMPGCIEAQDDFENLAIKK